jgi:microcompartment protein CcmL/EutN
MARDPAIGVLELNSIARGIICTDAMAKAAPINVALSQTICPGKYLVMISGDEDPVRESMEIGRHYAGNYLVDDILIPNVHEQVVPAVSAVQELSGLNSVGIIETFSVAGTILAADAACKAAEVKLIEVRLANGLGGKAYFTMSGDQSDIEAALAAGVAVLEPAMLVREEIIPAPHEDLESILL